MRALVSFNVGLFLAALACLSIVVSIVRPAAGDDAEPRERIVLMTTGRILTGFATRNAGGWLVEQSGGRVQVPIEQVRVVANSMVDAYRQQRDSVVEPTPATHIALAQWCISYRLHNEARDELRNCLKLDPDHSAARKLLRRLDDIMDRADAKPASVERAPRRSAEGFLVPDAESLGGLSNEAAVNFTQRIQPLLMNKCGNASCHGTTTPAEQREGFRLVAVRSGSNAHRLYTERNLAEVLRYIDVQEPLLSPLVTLPQGTHGGTAGVFHGTTGNSQIKMLRAWIKTVADEKRADEEELSPARFGIAAKTRSPSSDARGTDSRKIDADPFDVGIDRPTVAMTHAAAGKRNREVTPESVSAPHPMELTAAQRLAQPANAKQPAPVKQAGRDDHRPGVDPFDPDVFNRQFHSPPRR